MSFPAWERWEGKFLGVFSLQYGASSGLAVGGATMNLRRVTLLACALCLASRAAGQLQPGVGPTQNPSFTRACSPSPRGETAWFDTCKYLPIGNGVKIGRPLSTPDPPYSEVGRTAKIKGTVVLAVALNAAGTVDAVRVVRSLEPSLDQNAVDAVRAWIFTSATKDGKPVPVQFEVSVGFDLY